MVDTGNQLCLDLFVVMESTGESFREKVTLPLLELLPEPSFQNLEIRLSDRIRNMLNSEDRETIFRDLSRRSAPAKNTHFSVCILLKKGGSFYDDVDGDDGEFLMYIILAAGVDVREGDEVYWNFPGRKSTFIEVIRVCKPPIPCLKRIGVDNKEELCCSICLQVLVAGSDAAKTTTCCHVYHCHCIVQWLPKHSSWPLLTAAHLEPSS